MKKQDDVKKEETAICPYCKNKRFVAHRVYHLDVIVDGAGQWLSDGEVYDAGTPFGPFTCTECGTEFAELEDIGK